MPDGLRQAVSAAIERDAYRIRPATGQDGPPVYEAVNRVNDLRFRFRTDGVESAPRAAGEPAWHLRMTLAGVGYEGEVHAVNASAEAVKMYVEGNRLEYHRRLECPGGQAAHASVVEWYINDRRGLEQGFTLAAPPGRSAASSSPLRLNLAVSGDLTPAPAEGGSSVRFVDHKGTTALRYGHLRVFDATGRDLSARLASAPGTVSIVVDDREALYPLTIDPVFDVEVKLTASDAEADDEFGISVSISGDTAIVGADGNDDACPGDPNSNSGSAYIFQRDQGGPDNWGEVTKLTASDAWAYDGFGRSVSISGDTAIVAAEGNDDAGFLSGSAYIFQRDQGGADNWGEVAKLTASDAAAWDQFGYSVSISGDTAIVGAYGNDYYAGSAYIFQRDQGGADNWGEAAKLTASDAAGGDSFGASISVSGDTAIVGTPGDDDAGPDSGSAYIFQRDQGGADNWGEVTKLSASDAAADDWFGSPVSISGDTAIVGVFFDDDAGSCSGSAYIFQRDQGGADNWGEVTKLTASDAAAEDWFGCSVSISGDTAIVGAHENDDACPSDPNCDSGSAYIFQRDQGGADNWGEVTKLIASDAAAGDEFGISVSISGDTAIVGACGNNDAGSESGSAYVFFASVCGDGVVEGAEECDDGDTIPGDGCDGNCMIEPVHNVTQDTYGHTIQAAIDNANDYDVVEVEPGTYYEAIDLAGLAITLRSTDGAEVTTIDATGVGTSVVTCANGEGPDTVLDGFTITGGTGTSCYTDYTCGGGLYNDSSGPTVTNCRFIGNTAALSGGGMGNYGDSQPTVVNCTFSGNAAAQSGGGIDNRDTSSPTVTNCTFSQNWGWFVGGMCNCEAGTGATVTNSVFWGNEDNVEGTVEAAQITGWGLVIDYSCVQGWTGALGGVGNTGADPLLVDPDGPDDEAGTADDNLRLFWGSAAVNAGTNSPPGGLPDTDLDGNPRIVAGIVDMGAYEVQMIHNVTRDTYHATIQAAIDISTSGDEIEVLPGIYAEAIDFGGLAITLRSTDGAEVTTIDATGLYTPVVTCANGEGPSTVLEGFTITNGPADEGPMYGGGMYNFAGASPTVINCTFSGNEALENGGGMYNGAESNPTVINCTFSGNMAYAGAGMYNDMFSHPTVTNCTFSGNQAFDGGGMYCQDAVPTVTNCTFTLNDAAEVGGAMYIDGGPVSIANCILWGDTTSEIVVFGSPDPTVTYSDVQGGTGEPWFGTGCIDVDPLFVDADGLDNLPGTADDNVRLSPGSLCFNAGDPAFVPAPGETDLDGHARVLCSVVDMGAYEFGIGDYDCNQSVDLTDFGAWDYCMTGPDAGPYPVDCEAFDFEYDDDVDLQDFGEFCLVCSP